MISPWESIKTKEYEDHMKHCNQYDLLNQIFKEQVTENDYSVIDILGIGCGNGLEHIKPNSTVYGYDVNQFFLNTCHSRIRNGNILLLNNIDLTNSTATIHTCDLLICNLVLEYIGLYHFIRLLNNSNPKIISVVLQVTINNSMVISESPYTDIFKEVSSIRSEIDPQQLIRILDKIGYELKRYKAFNIDQTKYLIQMDYNKDT